MFRDLIIDLGVDVRPQKPLMVKKSKNWFKTLCMKNSE